MIGGFRTHFETAMLGYGGGELRPHFLLERFGLQGSALAAFIGPCEVKLDHLVDWEDRLNPTVLSDGSFEGEIRARQMIHLIGEFFGMSLPTAVALQRLLMAIIKDCIGESIRESTGGLSGLYRTGDDLYWPAPAGESAPDRKLTVSIATVSAVSALIHVGINVDPAGAPVPAIGLAELGAAPDDVVRRVLKRFSDEFESLQWACTKVRPVV